jgi:hypothetical protein
MLQNAAILRLNWLETLVWVTVTGLQTRQPYLEVAKQRRLPATTQQSRSRDPPSWELHIHFACGLGGEMHRCIVGVIAIFQKLSIPYTFSGESSNHT